MAIVAEMGWDQIANPTFGTTQAQQAYQEAVVTVADRARVAFPASHSRIDEAVALVLRGGVELFADGTGRVASQWNGETVYRIVNGHCDCPDVGQAPEGWCTHRLSVAIARRAKEQAAPPVPPAAAATHPLPEAPASANCHVMIAGRQVQVTFRDTDETRLLSRLTALLALYPVEPAAASQGAPPEGWCQVHQVQMHRNEKDGHSWWSHKAEDGGWCKGKAKGQGR